jgi:hypothetical protein
MSRWFRHYAGMMRDDKLVRAALQSKQSVERVLWIWGAILESAAEINDGGRFDFDAAEAAYFLRSDEADIRAVLESLAAMQRVAGDRVVNWGARQFESDRSATRQAAYRERKRTKNSDDNDQQASGDGGVTAESRHCDAPETETETEKKEPSLRSDWPSDFRERFWEAYPRKLEKKSALAILDKVRRTSGVPWARFIAAVRAYAATADPKFTKHPTTWLNKGCWDDELAGATAGPASPTITIGSPSWNMWRAHFRDTGQDFRVKLMDKAASDDKPFTVPSEFPPGMQAA